jgi:hypothetical protein
MTEAGYTRSPLCRACCTSDHPDDECCDTCPFIQAGAEGQEVLRLFRLATEKYTDSKTKIAHTTMSTERLRLAFEVYNITEKERAFRYLALALGVVNGEQ